MGRPRLVATDCMASLALHVAVTGVNLDGRPVGAGAEFHESVRRPRTLAPTAFLLGLLPGGK